MGRVFRPYRWQIAAMMSLTLVSVALELAPTLLIGLLIGDTVEEVAAGEIPDQTRLFLLFGIIVALYVLSALLSVLSSYVETTTGNGVMFDVRQQMYDHLNRLSIHFFTSTRTGEILSRVSTDVNGVQGVITLAFAGWVSSFATLATALGIMIYLDWRLSIIAAIVLVVWIVPMWRVGQHMRGLQRQWQEEAADMQAHLQETLSVSGMMMVRSFGRREHEQRRFDETNQLLRTLAIRRLMSSRWFYLATRLFGAVSLALVYWWGARGISDGSLGLAEVITFALLTQRVFGPFSQLSQINTQLISSVALFQRIFEYLDMSVEIDERPDAVELTNARGVVAFEGVTFAYDEEAVPALQNVSFRLEPGQMAAIVGPSGAGKTTITYMLQRFYDPNEGRVTLDGHDLRDLTMASISGAVGVVAQDTTLFFSSLRDNIRYGRLDATDEEIELAARAAGLGDLMDDLPAGLDTVVGERGYRLSGGEKQRVSIARAILKDPPVLIMDEATASLDSRLEAEIRRATERLAKGRTTLVIAHRLSTVIAADVILVVEGGQVVERGTHAELLKQEGLYATLYRSQFARSDDAIAVNQ
ncbi:MAG: ABC transporter ATP-binding protein [Chloroflexi bacterium]|nr:ABC transporter ATP-binding protein [Chloroflexota bacterium]MDA1148239.1 ABC transporter ATP-binding protein [Chloroflexota bacterium]